MRNQAGVSVTFQYCVYIIYNWNIRAFHTQAFGILDILTKMVTCYTLRGPFGNQNQNLGY